jgi:Flp pilus assembly protein TadG
LRNTARGARQGASRSERGQALVEFALVLPLLMVFFLGVADFGRVFADGIALEAAARNSAEAAAQEYLQLCDGDCTTLVQADYDSLHALALEVGCREAERLTNVQAPGGVCTNPVIAVCVHDPNAPGDANNCGQEASAAPAECSRMSDAWSASFPSNWPADGRPYVEVRMCYLFDPLVPLTEGWWGDVRLQRENNFAVTNYP